MWTLKAALTCVSVSHPPFSAIPFAFLSRWRFGSHLLGLLVGCSYNGLWVSCPLERVIGSGSQELMVRLTRTEATEQFTSPTACRLFLMTN